MPIEVRQLRIVPQPRARAWLSDRAAKELKKLKKKDPKLFGQLLSQLERGSLLGFQALVDAEVIRNEWDGVVRLGIRSSLYRLIGFFEGDPDSSDFIILDCFRKLEQKLSSSERARIDAVVTIKESGNYKRMDEDNGPYPRLAR